MNENNPIRKPVDTENNRTTDYVRFIKEVLEQCEGYHAEYALGVSFGVDLQKWSLILDAIFNIKDNQQIGYRYNVIKKFDHALLITDSVYIDCTNKNLRDRLTENLKHRIWSESGYLHTKFILIKMVNDNQENNYRNHEAEWHSVP